MNHRNSKINFVDSKSSEPREEYPGAAVYKRPGPEAETDPRSLPKTGQEAAQKVVEDVQKDVQAEVAPRPVRRWRSLAFQGALLAGLVVFAAMSALANTTAYFPVDLAVTHALQTYSPSWFSALMVVVSWMGYDPQVLAVVAVLASLLFLLGLRQEAAVSVLAGVASLVTDDLVKLAVRRPRPSADLVHVFRELSSYSFPSGHVVFYTVFFGFLAYLTYTLLRSSWKRSLLLLLFGLLVALVGPSRIDLGGHWFSDVLGAYLLGGMVLVGIIQIYRLVKNRKPASPQV